MIDSPSISGESIARCRSFYKATTTGGDVAVAIASGHYEIVSSTDCDLLLTTTGVTTTGVPNAQPAATAPLPLIRLFAGVPRAVYIPVATTHYSTKAVSVNGTIVFNGPLSHADR